MSGERHAPQSTIGMLSSPLIPIAARWGNSGSPSHSIAAVGLGVKCSVGLAEDVALDWLGAGRVNAHAGLALPVVVGPHSFPIVVSMLF